MRRSERTYLTSIGFDDSDRKTDVHEIACLYLTTEDGVRKVEDLVHHHYFPSAERAGVNMQGCSLSRMWFGSGCSINAIFDLYAILDYKQGDFLLQKDLIIEVKGHRQEVTSCISQLRYYDRVVRHDEEMGDGDETEIVSILVTCYPITEIEHEALMSSGILHLPLSRSQLLKFKADQGL